MWGWLLFSILSEALLVPLTSTHFEAKANYLYSGLWRRSLYIVCNLCDPTVQKSPYKSQVNWKECCYLGPWALRWWDSLSTNLQWSAAYSGLFSLMNSRPCRRAVCVSAALDSSDSSTQTLSLKDDGRISLHLSTQAKPMVRAWGPQKRGRKCNGSHGLLTSRQLWWSMQTPPFAPFMLAGHHACMTPVCLREPARIWGNNKSLPTLETALMDWQQLTVYGDYNV